MIVEIVFDKSGDYESFPDFLQISRGRIPEHVQDQRQDHQTHSQSRLAKHERLFRRQAVTQLGAEETHDHHPTQHDHQETQQFGDEFHLKIKGRVSCNAP